MEAITESASGAGDGGAGAPPRIRVRGLTRTYRRPRTSLFRAAEPVKALQQVSFEVRRGERFGIVGESGCGKSTLLRLLSALDRPTSGSVELDGRDIAGLSGRALLDFRSTVQLVFQDPLSSLDPRMRVRSIVSEPLAAQGRSVDDAVIGELLESVGLPASAADRYPHQFSGGQRQRIAIARAIAPRPGVLIADEPVSALDVSVRAQVLNLIDDLVDELALTLVFVSHDLSVVRHVCERVAVMQQGEIVEIGPVDDIYERPQHPYTRKLIDSIPSLDRAFDGVRPQHRAT